ncbi:hypothetical protein [Delftia acidovorans]|uniref:hypothetical protein n=1 Tax=Delftia acidovorans TaxID=80866 RepID=UPI0012D31ED4|nr:hypothetical protein [Delftia acidovorans]QQB53219.1 hypothetical protein I6H54_13625 [Delftia acidovorans]
MSSTSQAKAFIGRSHFDQDTLAAMDEIAVLILACQSLHSMFATFKNAPKLDHVGAKPHAQKVLRALENTAVALQKAICAAESKRTKQITAARQSCLPILLEAAPSAQWLAERVSASVGGDLINVRVLGALREIVTAWKP